MSARRQVLAVASWCAAMSLVAASAAQEKDPAEVAFNKGLADMEAKRFDEACPAFAESLRLDPRPGTLFTLAECEAARGRIATAVTLYEQYLARYAAMTAKQKVNHRDREPVARAKRDELARELPELALVLPPGAPPGIVVTRDGAELAAAAIGVAVSIDPGEHRVTVEAPGAPRKEQVVKLARREKRIIVLEVPVLAVAPPPAPIAAPTVQAVQEPRPQGRASGPRTGAFVSLGVGVAGIAAGSILGGLALAKQGAIHAGCTDTSPGVAQCTRAGLDAANAAKPLELGSSVGFGVGVAGGVAALVLFLVAPRSQSPATARPASLRLAPGTPLGIEGAW